MSESPILIAGLGNPGSQYEKTRHNIGFMVAEVLGSRLGGKFTLHKKSGADLLQGRLVGQPVAIAKPRAYMNVCGRQVAAAAQFFSIAPDRIVVVHDELDIDFGNVRLKQGGGEGGHNGLRSLTASTGTKDYLRIRVGIGRPPGRMDAASYVLKPFSTVERKELALVCEQAADAVELLLELGLEPAQNRLHGS